MYVVLRIINEVQNLYLVTRLCVWLAHTLVEQSVPENYAGTSVTNLISRKQITKITHKFWKSYSHNFKVCFHTTYFP